MKLKSRIGYLIQRFHFILEFLKNRATKNKFLGFAFKIVAPHLIDYEYPINYNIETTNACNLSCRMCPRKESNRPVGYLSMDLCRKIVDEAKKYGPRGFSLHKDGEPLLHSDLFKIIEYIKKSNSKNAIYLTTNGILLDKEKALKILKSGVDRFNISIGAARKETFKKIKGYDALEKIEENVRNFIKLKKDGGYKTEISVQIIKLEETAAEIEEFKNKWKKYPVKINIWNFLNWGGAKEDKVGDDVAPKARYPCYALWFSPAINWDGRVSLCCMDWDEKLIIGDINNQNLAEIWQGEKLKNYRKIHLQGKYNQLPVCDKCNYWSWWPDIFFDKYKE
ncbi:MAG: radical SAM protein [Nanoarchaeota archaeon]|nr:radical SAM protein [Nanoarchaeota archaeon]